MVFATVDLGGRFAHNRRVRQTPQPRPFDRSQLKTRFLRERVIWKFVDNIDEIAGQRASVAEEAREFTEAILGAAHAVFPEARRTPRRLGWCERPAVRAALLAALDKKREARRQCKTKHTTATWKTLRAACKEVRAAIDKGIEVHLEEYLAELETLLRHRDMRGLYKHLKMTAGLGGRKTEGQQSIKDENGDLLRDEGSSAICSTPSLPHSNHPSSRRYSSGGRHRRRRLGQGRKSGSQYHSRQSQRTRRRRRQSGRWQTGKRRALTHSQ